MRIGNGITGCGIDGFGQLRRNEMLDTIRRRMHVIFGIAEILQVAFIYERQIKTVPPVDGSTLVAGWRDGKYQPESFRFGAFISLCALAFIATFWAAARQRERAI